MRTILTRLAAEPAAVGSLTASVLPALVALRLITLDAEEIGVLVVAVNTLVGFGLRIVVAPAPPRRKRAAAANAKA
jgi:hypothetical protein